MNLFVSINGKDVTGFLQNLLSDKSASTLIDIQVDDEAGGKSDKVTLKLVRDHQIALPPKGAQIIVSLPNAAGLLMPMGIYYSDAPQTFGSKQGGHLMTLCGTAADMGGSLKEKRTQSYDSTTLKKVVEVIAGRHSLEPVVSKSLASISVPHKDQTNVSDMHFLTEWAKELGAIFKVAHDKLMFVEKGTTKKASGAQIPPLQPLATQIISYEWSGAQRTEYKTVKAAYHDQDQATRLYAEAGSEEPVHTLCKTFASKAEAQKAADAALKDGIAGAQTARVTIVGDASARAEGAILLPPVQPELAGAWSIRRVTHSVRKGVGYTSKLDLERVRS
ncbi:MULTISPECIES: contractile injection system protein, VgrG/Pvc8 family [unclassified Pseudovibrio]|uniref:contractile injection system protein, VgrG/Pvc8 family n=1 Tax=unclassified Pseudovibrio TaxID=2627060 RepID=UPI00070C43D7|nr:MULTISPECIES: contractile injection system protein, VgrG/Pvc8 family [unclassified Pseudovibrio]KZL19709.1 Phage late control gene D protein (GPD) [Pseudovibrio sp. Ad37]